MVVTDMIPSLLMKALMMSLFLQIHYLSHGQIVIQDIVIKSPEFATAEEKGSYFTPKILGNMAVLSKNGAFSATVNGNHLVIENL